MKFKVTAIAAIALLAVSCKKDYTCSCTDTTTGGGEISTDVYTYQVKEATKDQAAAACNEATIVSTYSFGGNTYTTESTCTMTK